MKICYFYLQSINKPLQSELKANTIMIIITGHTC